MKCAVMVCSGAEAFGLQLSTALGAEGGGKCHVCRPPHRRTQPMVSWNFNPRAGNLVRGPQKRTAALPRTLSGNPTRTEGMDKYVWDGEKPQVLISGPGLEKQTIPSAWFKRGKP
ncbi:MAG: hypothetical protein WCP55_20930 [Lentisphaerota bacterium]